MVVMVVGLIPFVGLEFLVYVFLDIRLLLHGIDMLVV